MPAPFDPLELLDRFDLVGTPVSIEPYGSGHINQTFVSVYSQAGSRVRYIHQKINHNIFLRVDQLMENIQRVLEHQARKVKEFGRTDPDRRCMTLIPGRDGLPYVRDNEGGCWRTYLFVERTKSYDVVQTAAQARQIARAVGRFQLDMADFPEPRLHETIPKFHDAVTRYQAFRRVIAEDSAGRASSVQPEIDWFLDQEEATTAVVRGLESGTVPERIAHNDTKANNILLDDATGEAICVIDLDTVMPGSLLYDFGDMVRTATATAAEDAPDPAAMRLDLARFEGLVDGFLGETLPILTPAERELLPLAGRILATIIGLRFLTDYLAGDKYFKTARPHHNLDRARTQRALVQSMDAQAAAMRAACDRAFASANSPAT